VPSRKAVVLKHLSAQRRMIGMAAVAALKSGTFSARPGELTCYRLDAGFAFANRSRISPYGQEVIPPAFDISLESIVAGKF
jgi:hypothetical protein